MLAVTEHDDVIKWKHFPRHCPFVRGIHRSSVDSPHKGQWRGALMFSLICAWINSWVNNREAGDLRCHHTHYDVTVMSLICMCGAYLEYLIMETVCCRANSVFKTRPGASLAVPCLINNYKSWVPYTRDMIWLLPSQILWPRPWSNIKMSTYQYRKSHCGDRTILRPSYLHNGISYTDKTSLYWIGALDTSLHLATKRFVVQWRRNASVRGDYILDSKVHWTNMEPTWVLSAQMGSCWPHKPCYQGSYIFRVLLITIVKAFVIADALQIYSIPGTSKASQGPVSLRLSDIISRQNFNTSLNAYFEVYGFKSLCGILKGTFEISHKILNPYTSKYAFYCLQFLRVSYDIFELWRHKPQWDGPYGCHWVLPNYKTIASIGFI